MTGRPDGRHRTPHRWEAIVTCWDDHAYVMTSITTRNLASFLVMCQRQDPVNQSINESLIRGSSCPSKDTSHKCNTRSQILRDFQKSIISVTSLWAFYNFAYICLKNHVTVT